MGHSLNRAVRLSGTLGIVTLSLLIGASIAQAAGEYEHNDTRDTAYGPLAGGTWYEASFETDNDVDWYKFYIKTYSQMDFAAGITKEVGCCYDTASLELTDKDGGNVDYLYSGELNKVNHLYLTLPAGRYYVKVEQDAGAGTGDHYKFRIDPASALTTNVECGEAIVAKESVVPLLTEAEAELAKKNERLAPKVMAVEGAETELGLASGKAKHLRAKLKFLRAHRPHLGKKHHRRGHPGSRSQRHLRAAISRVYFHRHHTRFWRRYFRWHGKIEHLTKRLGEVRGEVRDAVSKVNGAKKSLGPGAEERAGLEATIGQRQHEIRDAEGQIATHCS